MTTRRKAGNDKPRPGGPSKTTFNTKPAPTPKKGGPGNDKAPSKQTMPKRRKRGR